jgi:hypothetical protein
MSSIVPCLFGTTKGFEIFELGELKFKAEDLLVAITHSEVELALDDTCVKVLRIKSDNKVHTWVGIYRKAYEIGFSREGGYYGAGVWLSDTTVNARQIIEGLEDLCQQIRRLALQDRKFKRTLSDIVPQLVASPAVNALVRSVPVSLRGGISTDAKKCAFIAQPQAVLDIINWAQIDAQAHNFNSVIVAPASAFPRAGASASVTQYSDLAAVERALERDYTAYIAKLEALVKDWRSKAQSLQTEVSVRNSELQTLKLKNSHLEANASRVRLPVNLDSRGRTLGDDESWFLRDAAKVLLTVLIPVAIASFLGNMALWYFWKDASDTRNRYKDNISSYQSHIDDLKKQLSETQSELAQAQKELNGNKSDLTTAQNGPVSSGDTAPGARGTSSPCFRPCLSAFATEQTVPEYDPRLGLMSGSISAEVDSYDTDYRKLIMLNINILRAVKELKPRSEWGIHDNNEKYNITLIPGDILTRLNKLRDDGLINRSGGKWKITDKGDAYITDNSKEVMPTND